MLTVNRALRIGSRINNSTSGSVLFVDSSGNLAQDNSELFWDDVNKRLGIGITPEEALHLAAQGRMDTGLDFNYVSVPTALTATINGAGNVDIGTTRYLVSYITDVGETSKGATTTIVTSAGNQKVDLTNIPISSDYRVTGRKVYRDLGNYSFKLVIYLEDNTTTTHTDDTAYADLGENNNLWYSPNTTNKFITQNGNNVFTINSQFTFMGVNAGASISKTNKQTTLFGVNAGSQVTTALQTSAFGYLAGQNVGSSSVSFGSYAGYATTSSNSTFIGAGAGHTSGSDSYNTFVGRLSGYNISQGSNNTYIGARAGSVYTSQVTSISNSIAIGYDSYTTKNNQFVVGAGGIVENLFSGTLQNVLNASTQVGQIIQGAAGQSADLSQWKDSAGNILGVVDAAGNRGIGTSIPNSKLQVEGPISTAISTKTENYTITAIDSTILADGTSNTVTITLPTASGITGRVYVIKCIEDTFTVDVATNGSEEIDGDSTNFELIKDEVIRIQSNGTNWWII